jgi:hypothetical protein
VASRRLALARSGDTLWRVRREVAVQRRGRADGLAGETRAASGRAALALRGRRPAVPRPGAE